MSKTFDQQEQGNARPGKTNYGDPLAIDNSRKTTEARDAPLVAKLPPYEGSTGMSFPRPSQRSSGTSSRESVELPVQQSIPKSLRPRRRTTKGRLWKVRGKFAQIKTHQSAESKTLADSGIPGELAGRNDLGFEEAIAIAKDLKKKGVSVTIRRNPSGENTYIVER
jgi:hypothetical protein